MTGIVLGKRAGPAGSGWRAVRACVRAAGVAAAVSAAAPGWLAAQAHGVAADALATRQLVDSILTGHVHVLELAHGRLGGEGAALLREAARGARFVTLGENHNTRAIPELTVALFRMLHEEEGFEYIALEEGPGLGVVVSEAVRGGSGAFDVGLRYPGAFHMYTEEELRMMDRVAELSGATREPIWGVNQEFGVSHVAALLRDRATTVAARSAAEALLRRSLEYEGERFARNVSFLSTVATASDFEALALAFAGEGDATATELIEQLALSHAIYEPYTQVPRPHFTAFHESGALREQNMKLLFAERYRAATARDGAPPRVLVKSGHVHLNRGMGAFNEAFTLGNFLSELAAFEGGHSLHVYALLNWPDLADSFFAPLVPLLRPGDNTVIDLRPLRAWAAQHRIPGLDPELRRVLVGYDALVVLGDTERGAVEALRTPNFRAYPGS